MATLESVEANGNGMEPGDLGTLRCRVIDDAGGVGMIKVQLLNPLTDAVRSGAEPSDVLVLDAMLFDKD